MSGFLKRWLEHPLTRGMDIDDPRTTGLRRRIIKEKPFLRKLYEEWYGMVLKSLPSEARPVVELGSGAGFLKDFLPDLITSDVFEGEDIDTVLDGAELPFGDGALGAIVMIEVLHHLARPWDFFREASRCVRPGGVVVMIEPWVTAWSSWVYRHLHHEPFDPEVSECGFVSSGPLSGANSAMPWVLLDRDRAAFRQEFPEWRISEVKPMMPFRYMLSGGVSVRGSMPGWSYGAWRTVERWATPCMKHLAMSAKIVLTRLARGNCADVRRYCDAPRGGQPFIPRTVSLCRA